MSRDHKLTCYYTQAPEISRVKEAEAEPKIEIQPNEWKMVEQGLLFSKSFKSCIAVVAVLAELKSNRVELYLYHAREQVFYQKFIQHILKEDIRTIHIFSKTADEFSQHYSRVPILITEFKEALAKNPSSQTNLNRVEVPSYDEASFNPLEQKILLNKITQKNEKEILEREILMDLSQMTEKLYQWGGAEQEEGLGEEEEKDDKNQSATNFFKIITPATTSKKIDDLIKLLATDMLDHQAEEGGDDWSIRVYKALARVQRCDVIIFSKNNPIIIKPATRNTESKPIQIEDNGNGQYALSKKSITPEETANTIIAVDATQFMSPQEFARKISKKRGQPEASLSDSAKATLLYDSKNKNPGTGKSPGCCPPQCLIL